MTTTRGTETNRAPRTTSARFAPAPARRESKLERAALEADQRFGPSGPVRNLMNKVFPDHWSFMLGEIALYSFIVLLVTGTYLTFFFIPSMADTTYHGSYTPLDGVTMSHAFSSTLKLSFDVRGGLVIRQIHHWAALLFVAAIITHLLRVFFTGAFRKPRETNWLIGIALLVLGIVEGFAGYSLPDDLLSGTGLRIASAIILSIPVVGTWLYLMIFDGQFPGTEIVARLYIVHVLLIPGIILALIAIHLALLVKQKHTQFPGPGHTERNVVGERVLPTYGAKAGGFFAIVFGILALLGGLFQINPVWLYGPYDPSQVGAGSQPDWYMGFLEGSMRLFPSWEIHTPLYTVSSVLWPAAVLPGVLFILLALYPMIEAKLTKDTASHHLLQRPRDVPVRTSLGAMGLSFYIVLLLSGGNDVIADKFDISLNATTWAGRILVFIVPPVAYALTYRVCLGLQRHDREVLAHGIETGVIRRLPTGEFIEIHQPLGPVDAHGHSALQYAGTPVPKKMNWVTSARRSTVGFFAPIASPPEADIPTRPEAIEAPADERELVGRHAPPQE